MIFLDDITQLPNRHGGVLRKAMEDTRKLRVHPDVMALAYNLAVDADKLVGASPYIFMPAFRSWIEWSDDTGRMGFFFDGDDRSVTHGMGFWASQKFTDDEPVLVGSRFDIPGYELGLIPAGLDMDSVIRVQGNLNKFRPIVWAVLALINSPKIIRQREIDQRRINRRRQGLGRYAFHPHHEVRLNVDKHIIETVRGEGDGASRALHFVRTHLRFRRGQYELVSPHWRGDPALGIRDTSYRADRERSKWPGA